MKYSEESVLVDEDQDKQDKTVNSTDDSIVIRLVSNADLGDGDK